MWVIIVMASTIRPVGWPTSSMKVAAIQIMSLVFVMTAPAILQLVSSTLVLYTIDIEPV